MDQAQDRMTKTQREQIRHEDSMNRYPQEIGAISPLIPEQEIAARIQKVGSS